MFASHLTQQRIVLWTELVALEVALHLTDTVFVFQTKRNNVLAIVKWIYRPSEVPESVYQMLVQDRHTEGKTYQTIVVSHCIILLCR